MSASSTPDAEEEDNNNGHCHCSEDRLTVDADEPKGVVLEDPVLVSNSVVNKTLVNKCYSDPSSIRVRTSRYQVGATTRKCVLTLDGYSYVIGNASVT